MEETPREIAPGMVREAVKGSLFIGMKIQHGWTRLHGSVVWKKWAGEKKCESTNDHIWSSKKTDAGMLEKCGSGF